MQSTVHIHKSLHFPRPEFYQLQYGKLGWGPENEFVVQLDAGRRTPSYTEPQHFFGWMWDGVFQIGRMQDASTAESWRELYDTEPNTEGWVES